MGYSVASDLQEATDLTFSNGIIHPDALSTGFILSRRVRLSDALPLVTIVTLERRASDGLS